MNLEGRICRLRAVEPCDIDAMYAWENDTEVWGVSGTTAPYSREQLERFVERQRFDIWQTRQMRLMIEPLPGGRNTLRSGPDSPAGTGTPGGSVSAARIAGIGACGGIASESPCHATNGIRPDEGDGIGARRTLAEPSTAARTAEERRHANRDRAPIPTGASTLAGELRALAGGSVEQAAGLPPVGALDLFEFDPQHRRAGIGILIHDPAHRGKGFAADALDVVCRYARTVLGLHQLWCNVGADNTASLALFRRAGFAETGRKREWQWTPDGFRDEIMMQKILSDEG